MKHGRKTTKEYLPKMQKRVDSSVKTVSNRKKCLTTDFTLAIAEGFFRHFTAREIGFKIL
jgi:hypothetical protein